MGQAMGGRMSHPVEKLLYSRRDAAEALSLSIRSVDYLITTGRLSTRRVGGKLLIPAGTLRRFAREDHPDHLRSPKSRAGSPVKKMPISRITIPPVSLKRDSPPETGIDSSAASGCHRTAGFDGCLIVFKAQDGRISGPGHRNGLMTRPTLALFEGPRLSLPVG